MKAFVTVLLIQLLLNWVMIGIAVFAQIVHYPLYRNIKEGFVHYERMHIKRNAFLVGPIMLFEAITAVVLVGLAPQGWAAKLAVVNIVLLIFVWLSTFLLNVYQHQRLSVRFSKQVLRELISSNWIRLILYVAKGIILLSIVGMLILE